MIKNSFYTEDAIVHGVPAAVVIERLSYWCAENLIEGRNIDENGRVWTYNSINKWLQYFPYYTTKQLRTLLNKLVDAEVLLKAVNAPNSYKRDNKYSFVDQEKYLSRHLLMKESLPQEHRDKLLLSLRDIGANLTGDQVLDLKGKLTEDASAAQGASVAQSSALDTPAPSSSPLMSVNTNPEPTMNTDITKRANADSQMGASSFPSGAFHVPSEENGSALAGQCSQLTNNKQLTNDPANDDLCAFSDARFAVMSEAEKVSCLTNWFDEVFWPKYMPLKNKDRKRALDELLALSPTPSLCEEMLEQLGLEIEERELLVDTDQPVPTMTYAKSWIKNERWKDGKANLHLADPVAIAPSKDFYPNEAVVKELLKAGAPVELIDGEVGEFAMFCIETGRDKVSKYTSVRYMNHVIRKWNRYRHLGLSGEVERIGIA